MSRLPLYPLLSSLSSSPSAFSAPPSFPSAQMLGRREQEKDQQLFSTGYFREVHADGQTSMLCAHACVCMHAHRIKNFDNYSLENLDYWKAEGSFQPERTENLRLEQQSFELVTPRFSSGESRLRKINTSCFFSLIWIYFVWENKKTEALEAKEFT